MGRHALDRPSSALSPINLPPAQISYVTQQSCSSLEPLRRFRWWNARFWAPPARVGCRLTS